MIRARLTSESIERRERDLNPRGALSAPNRLAGDHLRPLGHPSEPAMVPVTGPPFGRTSARQAPVLAEPRFARSCGHVLVVIQLDEHAFPRLERHLAVNSGRV